MKLWVDCRSKQNMGELGGQAQRVTKCPHLAVKVRLFPIGGVGMRRQKCHRNARREAMDGTDGANGCLIEYEIDSQ